MKLRIAVRSIELAIVIALALTVITQCPTFAQTSAGSAISANLQWTNYYQGLMSGTGSKDWDYGGRLDGYANFDTGKLGWWKGGVIRLHAEYLYGSLSSNLGGALVPTNIGMRLPNTGDGNEPEITNISLVQRLSDNTSLVIGKINALDLLANDPFFGGAGVTRFLNSAFSAPPSGVTPPVIMGAILNVATPKIGWTFMLFDPRDRTEDYWPDHLFEDGYTVSVSAKRSGLAWGRTSSITLTGTYSTLDNLDLQDVLLPPDLTTGVKDDIWNANVVFAHFLKESRPGAGDGWGVFGRIGISDGNPNPFQGFITGGIGGKGLFTSRPDDTFGLGYFNCNFSDVLQDIINPLVQFDDEHGFEFFYDFAISPDVRFAVDLQYVDPGIGVNEDAFIGGVRLRFSL